MPNVVFALVNVEAKAGKVSIGRRTKTACYYDNIFEHTRWLIPHSDHFMH